jgi:UDP-N-acetylmuramate dehydrogenase
MTAAATGGWTEEAEKALRGARVPVRRHAPMARRTSFGVGGPARIYLAPHAPEDLADAVARLHAAGVPFDFLGAGSNLLVADQGPSFVVISTDALAAEPVFASGTVRVQAGYSLPLLVKRTVAAGLSGIEFAEGIPASVGGAVKMNAGWHEGMFGQAVARLLTVTRTGVVEEITAGPETFAYRRSPGLGDRCVLEATLALIPGDPKVLQSRVLEFRQHRVRTQPTGVKNAGCVFKNPPGDHAGRLIEACGLKGLVAGNAEVSAVHANFIVNKGGATCADILHLIDQVRDKVLRETGVTLEREVIHWT